MPTEDVGRQEQLRGSPINCVARVSDSNREAVATQCPGLPRSGGYLGRVEIGLATATLLRQSRNLIRVKQIGGRKNVCSLGS